MFALWNPNVMGLLQGKHPGIFAQIGVGCVKSGFWRTNAVISLKHGEIGPRLLLKSNSGLSIGAKINDLGWPWRVIVRSISKHMRLSELTVKIWMKIDLYCQRQRCSPMTLVFVNIRFVPIFEGVHWREGVKRQWGNRKHGFSRLWRYIFGNQAKAIIQ